MFPLRIEELLFLTDPLGGPAEKTTRFHNLIVTNVLVPCPPNVSESGLRLNVEY